MKPESTYGKGYYATDRGSHFQLQGLEAMDLDILLADMKVRAQLCATLADMSSSMRALLGIMSRHNFITVLPDSSFAAYEHVMERIGTAVGQAGQVVERSRNLDRQIALEKLPIVNITRQ